MSHTAPVPPTLHLQALTQRAHDGGLPGYGVRWDNQGNVYRVRNELTGEWKLTAGGSVDGWRDFEEANAVHRLHQPPSRGLGW
jgi:hypothetical protein